MLRGLLADAEVAEMNAAVDAMTAGQDYTESVSYANGSPLMRGTRNIVRIVADALGITDSTHFARAMEDAGYTPADELRESDVMSRDKLEQVLRNFLPPSRGSGLSDTEVSKVLAALPSTAAVEDGNAV